MARLLVLLALALILAYLAARGMARLRSRLGELFAEPVAGHRRAGSQLVACSRCGIHIPQSRALAATSAGAGAPRVTAPRFYCSEDCRRAAKPGNEAIRSKSA